MKKIFILILIFIIAANLGIAADEVLCYTEGVTDSSSFNIYTGRDDTNNPIKWTHNIPAGILERVVRVGLYIEAYDVDYPSDDEHDRVYFNGYDLGLLEGINNTWMTVEKTVPVEALKSGINNLKVVVDELGKTWKVTIRASELRFYCSTEDPDFSIGSTPKTNEINAGDKVNYKVDLVALNGFDSPVTLSISGLPKNSSAKFSPNPAIPTISSELVISTNTNTPTGKYKLGITGTGGGQTHSEEVELNIKDGTISFIGEITNKFFRNVAKSGDIIELNVNFRNRSGIEMKKVEVYSTFSEHFEYTGDDSGVSPRIQGGKYSWVISEMAVNETKNINVKFKIKEDGYFGVIKNISYLAHSSIHKSFESNYTELLIHKENISLVKRVDKSQTKPLGELNYTLSVNNNSSFPVNGIEIEDVLSDHLEFISQESDLVFLNTGNKLVWKTDIDINKEVKIKIKVKVKSSVFSKEIISNKFKLSSSDIKEDLESNTVSSMVIAEPVVISKVKFTKRAEIRQSEVGRIVRFRFTIDNNSNSVLIAPRIKDQLPQGFSYVKGTSVLNGLKTVDPIGKNVITWRLPDIPPKRSVTLRFQTVIGADVKRGKNINRGFLYATDSTGKNITLDSSDFINVSTSGFVFYSGVEGTVFIDRNKDEFYSTGDTALEGIEIRLSTGDKAFTNKMGEYSFKDLKPGEYGLGINRRTLPERFKLFSQSPVSVTLFDGLTDQKDFGLVFKGDDLEKPCRLKGIVYIDKNNNKVLDEGERMLENYTVTLDKKTKSRISKKGYFVFTHLKEGKHSIKIEYGHKKLIKEVSLKIGKNLFYFPVLFTGITIKVTGDKK